MKAFIFDPLWGQLATNELLDKLSNGGVDLVVTQEITPLSKCKELFEGSEERILCINPDYVNWKLAVQDYQDIPNLKAILIASTSYSWLDTSFADANNIPIVNIRDFSSESVAEWVVTMMLNLARQVPRLVKANFPLDYDADYMNYRGIELKGKTVGVAGLGNIGSRVASLCDGLGMNVIYWSRSTKDQRYKYVELDQLFKVADVIIPTIAHTKETEKIITDSMLESIKQSAIVVSVVEKMFEYQKLITRVENGDLFGFGFEGKPGSFNDHKGNIWAAPAYAWATKECMDNSMAKWVENMVSATNDNYPNRVN